MEERIVERAEMKLRLDSIVIQQGKYLEAINEVCTQDELFYFVLFSTLKIVKSSEC